MQLEFYLREGYDARHEATWTQGTPATILTVQWSAACRLLASLTLAEDAAGLVDESI
jgi:hypothetical protein